MLLGVGESLKEGHEIIYWIYSENGEVVRWDRLKRVPFSHEYLHENSGGMKWEAQLLDLAFGGGDGEYRKN